MIYGKEFEERKNKVNEICKNLNGKDDKILLQTLYSVANIEETQPGTNLQERLSKTPYTGESMSQFLNHFKKEEFTKMSKDQMAMLFQELHNRECKRSDIEPRYIVSVKGSAADGSNGYMVPGANELNINGGMIDRYKNVESKDNYGKNANTIGAHSALTLIHETQHTVQMEGVMNFALGREKTKEERGRDAIFFLDMVIGDYAYEKGDKELQNFIRNAYWFNYMEHHSNMAPVKFMQNAIKNGDIKDQVFLDALAYRTTNDIHIKEQPTEKRVIDMEKIIVKYTNIIRNGLKDGPLKNELVTVLDDFCKVDANGNSMLRETLTKDFDNAKELIKYCQKSSKINVKNSLKNVEEEVCFTE